MWECDDEHEVSGEVCYVMGWTCEGMSLNATVLMCMSVYVRALYSLPLHDPSWTTRQLCISMTAS